MNNRRIPDLTELEEQIAFGEEDEANFIRCPYIPTNGPTGTIFCMTVAEVRFVFTICKPHSARVVVLSYSDLSELHVKIHENKHLPDTIGEGDDMDDAGKIEDLALYTGGMHAKSLSN